MENEVIIRHAKMQDAPEICDIVNYHAERGRMLHRSLEVVYIKLRTFIVAEVDGHVAGCVAVEIAWADLAEIKSLAVKPGMEGRGIGQKLMAAAKNDAKSIGLGRLFALTYELDFFKKQDFHEIDRYELPSKVWSDCAACPKRDACDEIAVMLEL